MQRRAGPTAGRIRQAILVLTTSLCPSLRFRHLPYAPSPSFPAVPNDESPVDLLLLLLIVVLALLTWGLVRLCEKV
jgi:hypothetical protein